METILLMIFFVVFGATVVTWFKWNKNLTKDTSDDLDFVPKPRKEKPVKAEKIKKTTKVVEKKPKQKKEKTAFFKLPKLGGKKNKKPEQEFNLGIEEEKEWNKIELKSRNDKDSKNDFMDFEDLEIGENPIDFQKQNSLGDDLDTLLDFELGEMTVPTQKKPASDFDELFNDDELKEIEAMETTQKQPEKIRSQERPRHQEAKQASYDDLDTFDDFELPEQKKENKLSMPTRVQPQKEKEDFDFDFDFDSEEKAKPTHKPAATKVEDNKTDFASDVDFEFDFDFDEKVETPKQESFSFEENTATEEEKEVDVFENFDFNAKERDHIDEDYFEKKIKKVDEMFEQAKTAKEVEKADKEIEQFNSTQETNKPVQEEKKSPSYEETVDVDFNLDLMGIDEIFEEKEKKEAEIDLSDIFEDPTETPEENEKAKPQQKDEYGLDLEFDFSLDEEYKVEPVNQKTKPETPKQNSSKQEDVFKTSSKFEDDDDDEILKMIDNLYKITKDE